MCHPFLVMAPCCWLGLAVFLTIIRDVVHGSTITVTVCPADEKTMKLVTAFQKALCFPDHPSCASFLRPLQRSGVVTIFLDEPNAKDWKVAAEASVRLAKCRVPSNILSCHNQSAEDLSINIHFQIDNRKDAVIALNFQAAIGTFDPLKEFEAMKRGNDSFRCTKVQLKEHTLMKKLFDKCSNVLWILGKWGSCERAWDALRIYRTDTPGLTMLYDWLYGSADFETLTNTTLKVGTIPYAGPFVRTLGVDHSNKTIYDGAGIELLNHLSEKLKFKYELVEPPDRSFGIDVANQTFNGVTGMLQRKEIDLIVAPLTASFIRSQVVDFTPAPFHFDSVSIMISTPSKEGSVWRWTYPFYGNVWLTLATALVMASVFFYVLYVVKGFWMVTRFRRLDYCAWYLFAGLVGQSAEIEPVSWFGQTFLSFWWILCLIFTAAYNGCLIALLTTYSLQLPFENLTELATLLKHDKFKLCMENTTSFYNAIMVASTTGELIDAEYATLFGGLRRIQGTPE